MVVTYSAPLAATGDSGRAFVEDILTADQRKHVTAILDLQRNALQEIMGVRREMSIELRKLLSGEKPDENKVLALGRRYGELDGELSWYYATAFARISKTLTDSQRAALVKLRNLTGYEWAPIMFTPPLRAANQSSKMSMLSFSVRRATIG